MWYLDLGSNNNWKIRKSPTYGAFLDKGFNKWFDGYQTGQNIILDDFGKDHAWMSSLLKRWADKYAFTAETKGGMISIRPPKIIITSNYHPSDIWELQRDITDPIFARFEVLETHARLPTWDDMLEEKE